LPKVTKIALIYNPGEPNSVTLVKMMKEELVKRNIAIEDDGVNSQSDVAAAAQKAVQSAQAILIPTDNTVSSAFPVVQQIADKANVPIITTWTGETNAPLMQFGVDYTVSGEQAAQIMKEILLDHKKPMDIPIMEPNSRIIINSQELKKF